MTASSPQASSEHRRVPFRYGRLHSLITGKEFFEGGITRRVPRRAIARLIWRVDRFRIRSWWWRRTPWWTDPHDCGCVYRRGDRRVLTCLHHFKVKFGLLDEDDQEITDVC